MKLEKLEDLKHAYEKASTEKERAEIELQFWTVHGVDARRQRIQCDDFLYESLGSSRYESKHRLFLIRLGAIAEPLWPLVEGEMTLATAAVLARKARITQIVGEENPEASSISRVLTAYNKLPVKKLVSPGKFVRMARARQRSRKKTTTGHKPSATSPEQSHAREETNGSSFRARIRALVLENLTERLRGSDEFVIQEEMVRFETDLKILLEDLDDRVHERRRENATVEKFIRRRDFEDACRVLHLDPPKKIDSAFEKIAKRNFKELARQYHTDVSGTDTKAAFNAVMKAWKVIQAFAEKKGT